MKKYEELYAMIKSMDMQEKRYFKLFASRHVIGDSNKYVELFDAIASDPNADDQRIKKKFKVGYVADHFPVAKQYLIKLIQKSLFHYHDNDSPEAIATRYIRLAEIYLIKSEYALSESAAKKALETSLYFELWPYCMRCLDLLRQTAMLSLDPDKMKSRLDQGVVDMNGYLKQYENDHLYKIDQLAVKLEHYSKKRKPGRSLIEKLVVSKRYRDKRSAISLTAQQVRYILMMSYNDHYGDAASLERSVKDILDFFKKNEMMRLKNKPTYLAMMYNYILALVGNEKRKAYRTTLKEFLALSKDPGYSKAYINEKYVLLRLEDILVNRDYDLIPELVKETELIFETYKKSISLFTEGRTANVFTIGFIQRKELKNALKWNNRVINDHKFTKNEEVFRDAIVLNFLLHLLLQNFGALKTNYNHFKKYLNELTEQREVEKKYLNAVPAIFKARSDEDRNKEIENFVYQLSLIKGSTSKQEAFFYLDHVALLKRKKG